MSETKRKKDAEGTAARSGCARWRPSTRCCASRPSRSCSRATRARSSSTRCARSSTGCGRRSWRRGRPARRPPPRRRTSRRPPSSPWVARLLEAAVTPSLRRVINATGVVVHTNLGRALLPRAAVEAVVTAAMSYSDLEYSLARGERASRQDHVHDVLCTVTGAEDALAVNNNAAAVLLALAATARGGEVLVARGQLVEIGDGFRIPDILRESGAELVEVGTTNRTYLRDFEAAWTERTRAVLRVHTSNYRIVGFTAEPALEELATLAHERGAVLVDDLGSGALADLELFAEEPALADSVAAGCDIVTFSGDKLLGGPQAGIAVGRAAAIEAMRRHPLARALRIDKLDLAALDVVLRLYLDPARADRRDPDARRARASARGRARARRPAARAARRRRRARGPARARRDRRPRRRRRAAGHRGAERRGRGRGARGRGRRARRAAAPRRAGRRLPRAGRPPALRPARRRRGRARGPRRRGPARPRSEAAVRERCRRRPTAQRSAAVPPLTLGTAGHIDHGKTALVTRSPARTPTACARSASAASPSSSATPSWSCPPARG